MHFVHTYFLLFYCFIVQFVTITVASAHNDEALGEKRAIRNALVRFDRSGIRNALVRFGKRMSDMYFLDAENRRATALNPSGKVSF
ncbi:Uncharacterized protein BM_BM13445 [Brugia malayi]|uniref:BMA-FLP-11, isoform b n=1 Tax=Brugia malayi TaxID=6279 RepID=A0A1P6BKR8_BRUMA|nr:Uncharacterized protein BM_BM13445 [Brugia malayi]CDP95006.1 BMA-FLP-11, isoform b [Brugia malayi]VIO87127.1 Uncharacterized protein BM_BM13445 [Brugia malayi]